ncbi:Glycosyl transferase family 8 [Musa troglodytarum]|uniref:Glycosyl transferase family 8 n=1 Tax=Musa troglodytarum TaxID=320322 RepID=A0A9E7GDN8_9LILI|nr:Glycosyl transferase family 8 [Musa troglodytarum]
MVARNRGGVVGGIGGGICRPMVVLRRPWTTVVILALLAASFVSPLLLFLRVPAAEIFLSHARKESDREGNGIVKNPSPVHASNSMQLNAIEQEVGGEVKELKGIIYNDEHLTDVQRTYSENVTTSGVANDPSSRNSAGGEDHQNRLLSSATGEDNKQGPSNRTTSGETKSGLPPQSPTTEKILEMEDQINMAKAYLLFSSSNGKSHLVRELKIRIKEIERKLEAMEVTLSKARKAYPDCSAVASKLRAQLYNAEEQLRAQQHQASYLIHLTAGTFPRGLHCLSMRLTTEYFALQPEQRKLPNSQNVHKLALYHYAIFSDNVLACAVLVNSTTSTSMVGSSVLLAVH